MTALWTHTAAEQATGGKSTADWYATGISIDTRTLAAGDLFVALKGPNHDGHDHLNTAAEAGAAAAIVAADHPVSPEDAALPLLQVTDTLQALTNLATAARERSDARIIAITGSVGKTGTKEGLALAFGAFGKVHATQGNLNNDIGLPLTLARMPEDTDFAVLEMGMNHPGEIEPLSLLARPHVAIITTVQPVHLEFFDGIQEIADAKAEIFKGVVAGGQAVLPRDHPLFHHLRDRARTAGVGREAIVTFGAHPDADLHLVRFAPTETGGHVTAAVDGTEVAFDTAMPGLHWAENSLAVLAAAHCLGQDVAKAALALSTWGPTKGRGTRHRVDLATGGILTIIDESYNASPPAMKAALDVLGQEQPGPEGRRIAVLGDMLELGDAAPDLHAALAQSIKDNDLDMVLTAGPNMAYLHDALPNALPSEHTGTSAELIDLVTDAVRAGDVILVKGSLGSRMAPIVQALRALQSNAAAAEGGH